MRGYWNEFLARQRGICFVNDNGGAGGGGGDSGGSGGSGTQQQQQQKPEWASEFGDNFDPEKAWSLIKNLRNAERTLGSDKSKLEKRVKEFEDSTRSETERAASRLKELEDENNKLKAATRTQLVAQAVAAEAEKQGAIYPSSIHRLLEEGAVTVSDDGKVTGVSSAIKELKEQQPLLFKTPGKADGGDGRNGAAPSGTSMNDLIRMGAGRSVPTNR